MRNVRFAIFALFLTGALTAAVGTLVAQSKPPRDESRARDGDRRLLMLDGRGGQIGVFVDDLNAEEQNAAGNSGRGVLIERVEQDSPAARAGLREGDVVVEFDGEPIRSARQFSRLVQETPVGRSVPLAYVRDGKRQTAEVVPESRALAWGFDDDLVGREIARGMREVEPRLREIEPRLREFEREFRYNMPDFSFDFEGTITRSAGRRLGVQAETLSPQLAEYFGAKDGGVLVSEVTKDSPADRAGLKAGDVITSIDGDRVRSSSELVSELGGKSGDVSIGIIREKQETTVKTTIEPQQPRRRERPLRPAI